MDDQGARDVGSTGIDEQRRRLEEVFVHGWVSPARGPVTFSEDELARVDQVREHGGFLNKQEHEYLQRLRAGGRRGDPLPAASAKREPFISGIADEFEVRIATTAEHVNVVVLFSYERWPGIRCGHRFSSPDEADGYEDIWLMEEIDTGGLGRLMGRHPSPDDDGIIWTDWGNC